ncbi:Transient receptor potential cation channel subfamily A member 1 [Pseudolycoriella hygida]|uniref:Transient receptor potential cation channel subfamily A member 1 n=1 Tax=Pseudolycoriella hygida TaxID=35572 RepID=A0A9Q0RVG0_9DIPT|nr:Transient receptor potential cation channel subfamily A member 1 [Pseudolycoriella hygida]
MELIEYPNTLKCKLGFFDFILRKWFCNPFTDDATVDMMMDNTEDYLTEEMEKQKKKLRDISNVLENQHQLLRLIIQKMEIKTEADDVDEGVSTNEFKPTTACIPQNSRWNSPLIRKKLKHAMSFTKN